MKELKHLRFKFVLSNMTIVTLLLCLSFFAVGFFNTHSVERDAERFLNRGGTEETLEELLFNAGDIRLPHFTLILDGEQNIIGVEGQYSFRPDESALRKLAAESLSAAADRGFMEHYQLRYARLPFEDGYKIAYVDTSIGASYAESMWRSLLFAGVLVWLGFFAVSLFLSSWAVRPVERSVQREKQFIADASHELKTPLTVIMANAELLSEQLNAYAENAEASGNKTEEALSETGAGAFAETASARADAACGELRRRTQNIAQESAGMKRLVEEMLLLAKTEGTVPGEAETRLNLSDLAIESVLSFEALFYQEGKELTSGIDEGIFVRGREDELRKLLSILLENAEKYCGDGGRARVELRRSGKQAMLSVYSTGEAIPPEKRKALFDRFYRGDAARRGGEGFGLGLSIAKNITAHHKGSIYADSADGENVFTAEFKTCA